MYAGDLSILIRGRGGLVSIPEDLQKGCPRKRDMVSMGEVVDSRLGIYHNGQAICQI